MPDLGELRKLDPRTVWPHEAHEFTPWLADHIDELGRVLGLELELEEREAAVGTFALDLLARDLGTDELVVVENQFGPTDHSHLGQLLTYAAGYNARAVVWVGETLREEHRQALDWLNQRTDSDTHFFGVIIEVLQIDQSKPAFRFRPVVLPNEWQKLQKRQREGSVSERGEAYRQYFQQLIDRLREEHRFTSARVGQPQSWYAFASGFSSVSYVACFGRGDKARTELYIGTSDPDLNEALFDWLSGQRQEIESELGRSMEWERLEDRKASRIATYRDGSIEDNPEQLEALQDWHVESLLALRRVFGERLQEFKRGHSG